MHLDPFAARDAVARCRQEATRVFEQLVAHPDVPSLFRRGKAAAPACRGFRNYHPDRLRAWLADQHVGAVDRLRVPVPRPTAAGGDIEMKLVDWPVWAVGAGPLAALADLRAAEALADKLGRGLPPTGGELAAYARLWRAGRPPPCLAPRPGHGLVRVGRRDLPAVALAARLERDAPPSALAAVRRVAPPGEWLRARLAAVPGLPPLTAGQAAGVLSLVSTGAGIPSIGALAGWLNNFRLIAPKGRLLIPRDSSTDCSLPVGPGPPRTPPCPDCPGRAPLRSHVRPHPYHHDDAERTTCLPLCPSPTDRAIRPRPPGRRRGRLPS